MILNRIQRYLGIMFFTTLVITQAIVFVGVSASNNSDLLKAVFIEPISQNVDIGDSIYFQAMLEDKYYDLVYFNLKNPNTGLDENYQASLVEDGTWIAQSVWDTSYDYSPGQYYLSVVAHDNSGGQVKDIYYSQQKIINLNGQYQLAAKAGTMYFDYPQSGSIVNPILTPSITAKLYINSIVSETIGALQLTLFGANMDSNSNTPNISFPFNELAMNFGEDPANPGYSRWEASTNIVGVPDGQYTIQIQATSGGTGTPLDANLTFTIERSTNSDTSISTSLNILSPSGGDLFTMDDNMNIEVETNLVFTDDIYITAELNNTDTGDLISSKILTVDPTNPLRYSTLVDFDANLIVDNANSSLPDGGIFDLTDVFPIGNYRIFFYMASRISTVDLEQIGQINFVLASSDISDIVVPVEPIYEIRMDGNVLSDNIIQGNDLNLNFTTTWPAENFSFSLVKERELTSGLDQIIPAVVDGTIWQYSVSAEDNDMTNGRYILRASASDAEGNVADFGPLTFQWQITAEDEPITPSLAIHLADTTLNSESVLIGSGNILNSEFILENNTNGELFYSFASSPIDCSTSSIISQEIQDLALTLEHNYCFYYLLGRGEEPINSDNYWLYLRRLSATEGDIFSAREPVTFYADNAVDLEDQDVIFDLYEPQMKDVNGRATLAFPFLTSLDSYSIRVMLSFFDNEFYEEIINPVVIYNWDELTSFNIFEADNQNIKNKVLASLYLESTTGDNMLEDGDYRIYIETTDEVLQTDDVYFSIQDGILVDGNIDSDSEQNNPDEVLNIIEEEDGQATTTLEDNKNFPAQNGRLSEEETNLAIDFYSTCLEQNIFDQEICAKFQATVDVLDQTCLEQDIYEASACEDYLYRIETDLECQENSIVDKEECKNYLLEKYAGQVDCQLDNTNLCNSILRNEYLNRLVSGQRLSENINQVVDSLLGQNISTQELSDNLEKNGINSQEVLPLRPNKDIRVLLTRAQKETVLEEKDRLTILNQAIIILDADGDGLSEDLENYYGTETDNPDTDGDGFSDGLEIKNGYDPLGPGRLIKERTDFDKVILDDEKIIEQPKLKSKKIDKRMEVVSVDTVDDKLKLSGKAAANIWVNLYIYSGLPLVMTTKTDASGNWSYDIQQSLTDGHHRVFVTVNDDTGKIVKQSRPISFLIKEAQAVTVGDYFDGSSSSTGINNLFIYYILGGAFLVFLALGAIVFLHKDRKQNLEV